MPQGAAILTVQDQSGDACMWATVEPQNFMEKRNFVVVGTGHQRQDFDKLKFIGTFQQLNGRLVWHLFEKLH